MMHFMLNIFTWIATILFVKLFNGDQFGEYSNIHIQRSHLLPISDNYRRPNIPSNIECGHLFNLKENSTITISSPNFPYFYPPSTICTWKLQAVFGENIKITFEKFVMPMQTTRFGCSSDYLEMTDWTGSTRFCAFGPPSGEIVIPSSWVELTFVSDNAWQYMGFKALIEAVSTKCGRSFSEVTGVLKSPNYPFAYPANTTCAWLIQAPSDKRIQLDCTALFHLMDSSRSCIEDFLAISKSGDTAMKDAIRYCNHDGPGVILSEHSRIAALFRSDGLNSGVGFKCRYSLIHSNESGFVGNLNETACECGSNIAKRLPRIIGGNRTTTSEHPWLVSLTNVDGVHLCSGTVVHYGIILTAGHCVHGWNAEHIRVAVGNDTYRSEFHSKRFIQVEEIIIFPGYKQQMNDLALVKIEKYDFQNLLLYPICHPLLNMSYENETVLAIGWHQDETKTSTQYHLHQVSVPVLSHSECQKSYGEQTFIGEQMICAGSVGKDSCEGDSGGPLIWNMDGRWHVIGIISFGLGCGLPGFPGVYVRVSYFSDWLRVKVGSFFAC